MQFTKDDEFDTRLASVAALKHHDPDVLFFAGIRIIRTMRQRMAGCNLGCSLQR